MLRVVKCYPLIFAVLTVVLAAVVLSVMAQRRHDDLVAHQAETMRHSANGAAEQVGLLLSSLKLQVSLFARAHEQLLTDLYRDPENEVLDARVRAALGSYFPDFYAYTLVGVDGEVVVDDFGERVGDLCRTDIRRFMSFDQPHQAYIHPGPGQYHFDVVAKWSAPGISAGAFYVSFKTERIARLLRHSEVPGHGLFLTRRDRVDLIEVAAQGDRSRLDRAIRMSAAELEQVGHTAPVVGANWNLVSVNTSQRLQRAAAQAYWQVFWAVAGFAVMGAVLVLLVRREERRRTRAEQDLVRAKEVAEAASKAKTAFLSHMSHELRTPLHAILGYAELLQEEGVEQLSTPQQQDLANIRKAGQHLLGLISGVLDLARIEAGHIELQPASVALEPLIKEIWALVTPLAAKRALRLVTPETPPLRVWADEARVRDVLLNLLSNAVKYNRENGTIQLLCEATGATEVRFTVIDTGPGLSADQQARVFEPFERLGAQNVEGTGIGLSIAKSWVENMGGHMGVDSEPGVGSRFWFTLPLDQAKSKLAS